MTIEQLKADLDAARDHLLMEVAHALYNIGPPDVQDRMQCLGVAFENAFCAYHAAVEDPAAMGLCSNEQPGTAATDTKAGENG